MESARNSAVGRKSVTSRGFFFFLMGELPPSKLMEITSSVQNALRSGPALNQNPKTFSNGRSFPRYISVFINIHEERNYYNGPRYITISFGNERKKISIEFFQVEREKNGENLFIYLEDFSKGRNLYNFF